MVKAKDIYAYLDKTAPFDTQMDFDNAGFLVGDREVEVSRVMVALDVTGDVALEAGRKKCQLIVSHHPLIFHPLKSVVPQDPIQAVVAQLLRRGMAVISAHTNLDVVPGGVNDVLMDVLGVKTLGILEPMGSREGLGDYGLGRWGELPQPEEPKAFAARVKKALGTRSVRAVAGTGPVKRVAVCGGAGGDMVELAASMGMDAYVTADVKHHEFLAAQALGITLLDAGHFATEDPAMDVLAQRLAEAFAPDGVEVLRPRTHKEPYLAP